MSRNRANPAQSRGKRRRLNSKNKENLDNSVDRLCASLGISNQPESTPEAPQSSDDGFGLPEVIGAFALMSLAALINVQF